MCESGSYTQVVFTSNRVHASLYYTPEDIALYVDDQLECMELHLGMDEEPTESLWARIKGRAGAGDIIAGVCYRPPDQGDRADEALYRQIEAVSRSQALVLIGDFNRHLLEGQHSRAQAIREVPGMC
ncbi:hypothetical protein GRJ2_002915800 [Grus japonensis]|uniref:Endonuclease/exonuclease/phosphatase domain-containing protein n=1 Tax=Grus japonensis TaxID=30415 RepID=A0ABC9Y622_GRUJA